MEIDEIWAEVQCIRCKVMLHVCYKEQLHIDEQLLKAQKREYDERQAFWIAYQRLGPQIDQMIAQWQEYCRRRSWGNIYVTDKSCTAWAEANGYSELLQVERRAHAMRNDDLLLFAPVLYVLCPICRSKVYLGAPDSTPQVPFSMLEERDGREDNELQRVSERSH